MADKTLTVTNPSVVTNDTLAGYNNYSDIDGQLGTTMTTTEATNGKVITLSDGPTHVVTTKPVGTANGEFSDVISNEVTVSTSSILFQDTFGGQVLNPNGDWTIVSDSGFVTYSQDDSLFITGDSSSSVAGYLADYMTVRNGGSDFALADTGTLVIGFQAELSAIFSDTQWYIELLSESSPGVVNHIVGFKPTTTTPDGRNVDCVVSYNGATSDITSVTTVNTNIGGGVDYKAVVTTSGVTFYTWSGGQWNEKHTAAHAFDGVWFPRISFRKQTSPSEWIDVRYAYVTNEDFITITPF